MKEKINPSDAVRTLCDLDFRQKAFVDRLALWDEIYGKGVHLLWEPFMVDLALNLADGRPLSDVVESECFYSSVRSRLAGFSAYSLFMPSTPGELLDGRVCYLAEFVKFAVTKILGAMPSPDFEESCSVFYSGFASMSSGFKPVSDDGLHAWGFAAYVETFIIQTLAPRVRMAAVPQKHVSIDSFVTETASGIECFEESMPEMFCSAPVVMNEIGIDTMEAFVEESIADAFSKCEYGPVYVLHAGLDIKQREIARKMKIPLSSVQWRIKTFAKVVLDGVVGRVSAFLGVSDSIGRSELIGYLDGCVCSSRTSCLFEAFGDICDYPRKPKLSEIPSHPNPDRDFLDKPANQAKKPLGS